jgi:tRNA 2-thiouridine synthesizing protein B
MTLHTVNKSPFDRNSLASCLRLASEGHSVLLFEDGVYAAVKGTSFEGLVTDALKNKNIYVLLPDLEARGMKSDNVIDGLKTVDYAGFVDLAAKSSRVQAWL